MALNAKKLKFIENQAFLLTRCVCPDWLPSSWFRSILRWLRKDCYAKEENLNLLSEKDVLSIFPEDAKLYTKHFRLLGLISNLLFYGKV